MDGWKVYPSLNETRVVGNGFIYRPSGLGVNGLGQDGVNLSLS